MVRTRVFFGTLLIAALVGVVALDAWLTQQTVPDWSWVAGEAAGVFLDFLLLGALLTAVLAVVIGRGVMEMGRLCRAAGYRPVVGWSCFAAVILIILPWVSMTPALGDRSSLAGWEAMGQWLAISVWVAVIWTLLRRPTEGAIANMAITTWLIVYLGLMGSFVVRLRIDMAGPIGAWLVLYYIAVVKFTDIGAYFTGICVGRHPLAPSVSPNKTIEGFVGGLITGTVVAVAFAYLGGIIVPLNEGPSPGPWLSTGRAALFGLAMGLVGQIGDLIESQIKRDARIKDSGALVPTFGGVLDMIDSPLLTAPLAWWLLTGWLAGGPG